MTRFSTKCSFMFNAKVSAAINKTVAFEYLLYAAHTASYTQPHRPDICVHINRHTHIFADKRCATTQQPYTSPIIYICTHHCGGK